MRSDALVSDGPRASAAPRCETHLTPEMAYSFIVCLAERSAGEIRSQGREAPPPAVADEATLEFEFIPRIIASTQSMIIWRCRQRVFF
jgi:hypothetical protein